MVGCCFYRLNLMSAWVEVTAATAAAAAAIVNSPRCNLFYTRAQDAAPPPSSTFVPLRAHSSCYDAVPPRLCAHPHPWLKCPRSRSRRPRSPHTHRSPGRTSRPARGTHHAEFDLFGSDSVRTGATGCRTAVPGNTVVRFW